MTATVNLSPPIAPKLPPDATGVIARLAVACAVAAGIDAAAALRAASVPAELVESRDGRVPVAGQVTLLNLLAGALGDNLLGFRLACTFDVREAGLLYYVVASSETLGNGLLRGQRYSTVVNTGIQVKCQPRPELSLRHTYVGVARHEDRHQMEFWTTALVRICRLVTGTDLRPVRVSLAHPRNSSSGELEEFLGCPVTFGADRDEITFAAGAANLPLVGADPYLNDILVRHAEEALAGRSHPAIPLRARVENAIAPFLPHGGARIGAVARALGMSRRTLSRRLAREGLTFSAVLDGMRRDLALGYLRDPDLSVSRIAWLLGFREVSAFTHACKRWTGMAPSQVRSAHGTPTRVSNHDG